MSHFDNQTCFYQPKTLETLVKCLKREDENNNKEEVLKTLDCIMDCANVMYRELKETQLVTNMVRPSRFPPLKT
jgi:hypothetical protein